MTDLTTCRPEETTEQVHIEDISIGDRHRGDLGDINSLAESIQAVGLLHPVVVTPDHRLIAGLRRLKACQSLGWDTVPVRVVDTEELLRAEHDENAVRKDFTPSEAVAIGRELEKQEREKAKERETAGISQPPEPCGNLPQGSPGKTRDKVGRAIGMSGKTYEKAKRVVEAAEQDPNAYGELREKMDRTGRVDPAYKELRKRRKQERKRTVPADLPAPADRCRLICSDLATVGDEIEPGSVDWIITDPPYPKDYLGLFEELGRFASRALTDGGGLLCMTGQSYLPQVYEMLGRHLSYHWTLAYLTPGGQSAQMWQRQVNTFWKPVLWYAKGDYAGEWVGDVARSDVNDNDKRFHHWGQSESGMADIIDRFTLPGQTICDPFLGGGTTATVALGMGRRFTGIDIDPNCIRATRERMAANE